MATRSGRWVLGGGVAVRRRKGVIESPEGTVGASHRGPLFGSRRRRSRARSRVTTRVFRGEDAQRFDQTTIAFAAAPGGRARSRDAGLARGSSSAKASGLVLSKRTDTRAPRMYAWRMRAGNAHAVLSDIPHDDRPGKAARGALQVDPRTKLGDRARRCEPRHGAR